jgi:diguanylate cyclase (GGDEF)-like protein/PAS domain S-box-containing protein
MQKNPAFAGGIAWVGWSRRLGYPLRLAGCFFLVACATAFTGFHTQTILIWVVNGLLLSYLLLAPRWRWPAYLCVGFAAQLFGAELVFRHLPFNLFLTALNIAEVFLAAYFMRRRSNQLPRFTNLAYLFRFFCFALLGATLATGIVFSLFATNWFAIPRLSLLEQWTVSDLLGAGVSTPAFVAIFISRFRGAANWKWNWIYPVLFVAITIAGFNQVWAPLLFLVYPLLMMILLRLGLAWGATATLFLAAVGNWCTAHGTGPFVRMESISFLPPSILLQLFVGSGLFMVYAVSVVLESRKVAEGQLQEIVARYSLVTENSRDAIVVLDFAGLRRYFSPAVEALTGWPPEEFAQRRLRDTVHPDDLPRVEKTLNDLRSGLESAQIQYRFLKPNGECIWVETNMRVFNDPKTGKPAGILDFVRDITERKRSEQARDLHHSLMGAIHSVSLDGILVVDEQGYAVSYNKRFSEVWNISAPEIPSSLLEKGVSVPDEQLLSQCLERLKDPEGFLKRVQEIYVDPNMNDESELEMKDGRTLERYSTGLRGAEGKYLGRVWFFRDITERKLAEQKLQEAYRSVEMLAAMDALTGLANRRRFDECLEAEWRRAMRDGSALSMLLIDVDLFKLYNDTYGHMAGDRCLKEIAETAQDSVKRKADLVARFGGEEFTVILPGTANEGAMQLAEELCEALRGRQIPHSASPHRIVTISIGCATVLPQIGESAVDFLEIADKALYQAKGSGRNCICNGSGLGQNGDATITDGTA